MSEITPESVRAALPEWEAALTGDGHWCARLTTAPRVTGAPLCALAAALNEFLAGGA